MFTLPLLSFSFAQLRLHLHIFHCYIINTLAIYSWVRSVTAYFVIVTITFSRDVALDASTTALLLQPQTVRVKDPSPQSVLQYHEHCRSNVMALASVRLPNFIVRPLYSHALAFLAQLVTVRGSDVAYHIMIVPSGLCTTPAVILLSLDLMPTCHHTRW